MVVLRPAPPLVVLHYSSASPIRVPCTEFWRPATHFWGKGVPHVCAASTFDLNPSVVTTNAWRSRILAVILMIAIAGIFWVDSRYPALLKRYNAGTQIKAAGALTFGAVYKVDPALPLSTRVWRTTVNWLDANRIGMTFSFLFGPAALTFLATLRRRRTNSRYLNTLFGAAAGMPLGVCTNCVAPIARGLYASGMSTESVLAAMFASPALNVVVLAMTFALFPARIALIKLAHTPPLPPLPATPSGLSDLRVLCVKTRHPHPLQESRRSLRFPSSAPSLFSLFRTKREKLSPLFSSSSALSKKECSHNSFPINSFRTLLQNTRGCLLCSLFSYRPETGLLSKTVASSAKRSR